MYIFTIRGKIIYMNDFEIREALCQFIEDTRNDKYRIIDEFVIRNARADIVVVTEDILIGYEIKGDTDSYARLPMQIKEYDVFFQNNYLVIGAAHKKSAAKHVPPYWGIICVSEKKAESSKTGKPLPREIQVEVLREAARCKRYSFKKQFTLLWRSELKNILVANKLPKCSGKRRAVMRRFLLERVSVEALQKHLCAELLERDWTL